MSEELAVTSTPAGLTFEASFSDLAELRRVFERELVQGGYFLKAAEAPADRERCLLVLLHPGGARFELEAEAVFRVNNCPTRG